MNGPRSPLICSSADGLPSGADGIPPIRGTRPMAFRAHRNARMTAPPAHPAGRVNR
jgi:hypothetical protein